MVKLNHVPIEFGKFPNGETNLDKKQFIRFYGNELDIWLHYEDDSDLIKLMMLKKYLDDEFIFRNEEISLHLPYVPYSRMDRDNIDYAFSLKYVCEFINNLNFHKVFVSEPHSDVCLALINRCVASYPTISLFDIAKDDMDFDKEKDFVYFPDAGAQKRYAEHFPSYKQLVGFKQRDFLTGMIKSLDIVGNIEEKDFKVIIIDDLCSRGGTFMLSGNKLKEMGAKKISLVVGHCENTIHQGDILTTNVINKVYTTDSIKKDYHEKIVVLKG